MSPLRKNITRKRQPDKNAMEFNANNKGRKYKIKVSQDSAIYAKKSKSRYHLPKLYYLVSSKEYPVEENIQKPILILQYFGKLINLFNKNYYDKLTATSEVIDSATAILRPTISLTTDFTKQK